MKHSRMEPFYASKFVKFQSAPPPPPTLFGYQIYVTPCLEGSQ